MRNKRLLLAVLLAAISLALVAEDWDRKLLEAADYGNLLWIKMALEGGANVNARNNYGQTALDKATLGGGKDIVELLISRGADVDARDKNGETALMKAAQKGNKDIAAVLISKGADVNVKDYQGRTALIWAAYSGHKDIAELLISKGADVNRITAPENTALTAAALYGHKDICGLLISKGADVNAKNNWRRTALMIAAGEGYEDICELLVSKGADVTAKDKHGSNASDLASQRGHIKVAELLRPKVSTNTRSITSEDTFFKAIEAGDKSAIERMLSENANLIRSRTKGSPTGLTPLHLAALRGKTAILELLIQKGVDVNAKVEGMEFKNWTALHFMAFYFTDKLMSTKEGSLVGDSQRVFMLLKGKNADMNADDGKGLLPLDVARIRGSSWVAINLQVFGGKSKGGHDLTGVEKFLSGD